MPEPTLADAVAAVQARNDAAGTAGNVNARVADYRGVLAGTGLGHDELVRVSYPLVLLTLSAIVRGIDPTDAIAGTWVDGVRVGLELARQRQEDDR